MIVKLLTEHHLEFLSLTLGSRGSSESTHVKMSNCWKSHVLAHIIHVWFCNWSSAWPIIIKDLHCKHRTKQEHKHRTKQEHKHRTKQEHKHRTKQEHKHTLETTTKLLSCQPRVTVT